MISPKRKVEVTVSIIWLSLTLAIGINEFGIIWTRCGTAKRDAAINAVSHGLTLEPIIIGIVIIANSTPLVNCNRNRSGEFLNLSKVCARKGAISPGLP